MRRTIGAGQWAVLFLLAIWAALIYSNTLSVPFHFDDYPNISNNPRIKDLKNFLDLSGTRYLGYLSFALNYFLGGLNVSGYHVLNLLIHVTNAFLVYCLVRLLFRLAGLGGVDLYARRRETWTVFATTFLFLAHPVQSQAVTYISQRFTSLAALFYVLAVVCYLQYRLAEEGNYGGRAWYIAALASTVLAMKTKEIAFTLPFMLLVIEAVFFRPLTKTSLLALVPFILTLSIIPLSTIDAVWERTPGFARETTAISRSAYLFTQFRVIVTYLRLLVLPIHQNLDYDYPIFHSLFDPPVFIALVFLCALLGAALWLLSRRPDSASNPRLRLMAFGILWFFLTLSTESSIIPIQDVINEHRLYLPSIGCFLAFSAAAAMGCEALKVQVNGKVMVLAFAPILFLLSGATYQRNAVWRDELTLWTDVARKAPKKARAYNHLGNVYAEQGRLDDAVRAYQTALTLNQDHTDTYNSLGHVYVAQGRLDEAVQAYQTALTLNPDHAETYNNLGNAYLAQGRLDKAIRAYRRALHLLPNYAWAYNNLGLAYVKQGRLDEAIRAFQLAITLRPDSTDVRNNLERALEINE